MAEPTIPPPRRIVTSNKPLKARFADNPDAEPAVRVTMEEITPEYLFDGKAARLPIFTHQTVPTNNDEPQVKHTRFCISADALAQVYQSAVASRL
jgi:hypothetical protein